MDTNELLQQTYQKDFREAIGIAGKYEGTEDQFQGLMKHLIAVEDAVNSVIDNEKPTDTETEREVLRMAVDDVLSMAIESFHKRIKELLSESKILCKRLKGVLLPPGDQPVIIGDGSKEFEEPRFHDRLEELIGFLQINGIYTDDIVVCFGERYENMMRQLSYALVEIPRLNRQILVCDQIGEATFVIDGIFNRETLLKFSKEKLQEQYPDKVRRIIYNNIQQWLGELLEAVFYEWEKGNAETPPQRINSRQKVDVKKREEIVGKIKKKYTSKQFIGLVAEQRRGKDFAETGLGLNAIASKFDIRGNPISNTSIFIQVAQKIYGENDPVVKHAIDMQDPEKLKAQIKKVYTSEQFIELTKKQKGGTNFAGTGLGLEAIATMFGIKDDPVDNRVILLQLALKIYGEDDSIVQHVIDMQDPEKLKAQIIKVYPTSKLFIELTKKQKGGTNFAGTGLGLEAIATMFGIKDDPVGNRVILLQLALKIYGEDDSIVQHVIDMQDPEKLKAQIIKVYPTSKLFIELTKKQRGGADFAETGLGLNAIATIFDVKGNPVANTSIFLQLVLKIYGENDPIILHTIDMQDPEKLKVQIKKVYPTSKQFIDLTTKQRQGADFAETGLGLNAIATIFDVKGDPISYNFIFLQLALKIYGENDPIILHTIDMQDPEKLKVQIKKVYPTSKQFIDLTTKQRQGADFAETGLGLRAIATIFDVKGDPISYNFIFLQLALKIYGEG